MVLSSSTSLRLGRQSPQLYSEYRTPSVLTTILGSLPVPSEHRWSLSAGEVKEGIEDEILKFYSFFAHADLYLASVAMATEPLDILST